MQGPPEGPPALGQTLRGTRENSLQILFRRCSENIPFNENRYPAGLGLIPQCKAKLCGVLTLWGVLCSDAGDTHPPLSLVEGACGPSSPGPARVLNTCSFFFLAFIYLFWSRWVFVAVWASLQPWRAGTTLCCGSRVSHPGGICLQSTGSGSTGLGSGDTRASVAPGHVGSSRTGDRTRVPALPGGFLPTAPPGMSLNVCSCPLLRLYSLALVKAATQLQGGRALLPHRGSPTS